MATDKIKVAVRVRPFNRRGKYICGSYLPRYWFYCCCCCKSKVVWKLGNSGRKINRSKHGDEARTINRIVEIELLHYDDGVYCEVLLMLPPPTRLYSLWFYPVIGLVALFCSSSFIKTRRTTRNLTQFLYSTLDYCSFWIRREIAPTCAPFYCLSRRFTFSQLDVIRWSGWFSGGGEEGTGYWPLKTQEHWTFIDFRGRSRLISEYYTPPTVRTTKSNRSSLLEYLMEMTLL